MNLLPRYLLALSLAALLTGLSACDYPEQGFFALNALDRDGKVVASHVFEVEELVDDTDLTYGFAIHVYDPARKLAIDLPFDNVPEFTRRAWLFSLSEADYGAGDLALDITHEEGLSFVGAWRAGRSSKSWPLAGSVKPGDVGSGVDFELDLPPGSEGVASYRVEELSDKQVASRLGKLKEYKHVSGQAPMGLDPELGRRSLAAEHPAGRPSQTTGSEAEKPRYAPPPLGGKGGS